MRRVLLVLAVQSLIGVNSFGQNVDISGTVTSGTGGVLANVNVSLMTLSGISATTGTDGTYHLTSTGVIKLGSGLKVLSGSHLNGNILEFGLTGDAPVSIDLFGASGSKVVTLLRDNAPGPGNFRLNLATERLAPGVYFVRFRQGAATRIYRYIPTGFSRGHALTSGSLSDFSSAAVLPKAQDAAAVDTLQFTLAGYSSTTVPIASYTGQDNAILMPQSKGSAPAGMKLVPAGTFTMGTTDINCFYATPPHQVTITYSFYVDSTEVTQKDFKSLMNNADPAASTAIGDNLPVVGLDWNDAVLYCNARSKRDGRDTVYSYSSVVGTPGLDVWQVNNVAIDYTKNGYRLPTEAEWEYFARAGTTTTYYWGDTFDDSYCWYYVNSGGTPHPVASKKPNAWGLYDVSGNVWEFTNDWWAEGYPSSPQTDPTGPATASDATMLRCLRGGAWGPNDDNIDFMKVAMRAYDAPSWGQVLQYGIRAVCKP